jgi:hypothetical protein
MAAAGGNVAKGYSVVWVLVQVSRVTIGYGMRVAGASLESGIWANYF